MIYFAWADYWWFYLGFTLFVLGLLAIDLGIFHRKIHAISFREAALSSAGWVALALLFNLALYAYASKSFTEAAGRQIGLEFFTGYVVEKALSLDNIFVFLVVFRWLGIPSTLQHRVLFYGIAGALAFRAVFIAAGSVLFTFDWILVLFGALLILSAFKIAFTSQVGRNAGDNLLLRLVRRYVPVTDRLFGERFLVRWNGKVAATPLMLALISIEVSDVIFAVDSVPAIFALTKEPLIVFTSNVFAILGLRSLYFLLAGAVERFSTLKYGLAGVLAFVGLKMLWLNQAFGGKFPIGWSLGIIGALLLGPILVSVLAMRNRPRGENKQPEMVLEN